MRPPQGTQTNAIDAEHRKRWHDRSTAFQIRLAAVCRRSIQQLQHQGKRPWRAARIPHMQDRQHGIELLWIPAHKMWCRPRRWRQAATEAGWCQRSCGGNGGGEGKGGEDKGGARLRVVTARARKSVDDGGDGGADDGDGGRARDAAAITW